MQYYSMFIEKHLSQKWCWVLSTPGSLELTGECDN